ncbi:hypothetical protein [Tabrizicola flagellatus]|uniref:hypothetical protein n=1 Tax=Tabrizicola flagellatus TaxID=2593021 RepID=UPI0011F2847A|nr:hypothetical protein [Tabrizicola flagellatus]
MKVGLPIVVWASDFDENSGGSIVLHTLAHRLREAGQEAFLWNERAETFAERRRKLGKLGFALQQANRRRLARRRGTAPLPYADKVVCHPSMPVPTWKRSRGDGCIALYPEIIDGNPLGAPHVVRWLLHRPGFHDAKARFGPDELTFHYQEAFAEGLPGFSPDNLLQVRWLRTDIYRNEGLPGRSGRCRMVRKGSATFRPEMAKDDAAPLLDNMSHTEIAAIFNRCEYFYCHDPHTMYLYYAALCGCIPVVVPQPGLDAASWRAGFELKRGVAYGEAEIPFAIETRKGLLQDMEDARQREAAMVGRFLSVVKERFGG